MAKIISMSLSEDTLEDLDKLQQEMGFDGRSEAIRAGLRLLKAEHREQEKLAGKVHGALILVYPDQKSAAITTIRHRYQELVKSQMHNHIGNHQCLEMFVLEGEAKKVQALAQDCRQEKGIVVVKLLLV
ncbi:MAG TPA: CopG family ribbon-helix-helix protein [Candidatus Nanoarchaeia archaeon]|nr:CopG family ribbon-helix-helix protein [Candidatus Nanoarchaeia archaeon]